jgi:hypothetical protein
MKIKDIVNEAYSGFTGQSKEYGKVKRSDIDQSLPNVMIEPQLRNTDTYMQMRYGVALAAAAAAGDDEFQQESAWAENIGMVGYTDAEVDQIKAADKLMGVKSINLTTKGSQERTDVNLTSPVASGWKKFAK